MAFIINRGKRKGIFYIPSGGTVSPTPPAPSFSSTKSLDFDGVDDYVNCGNVTALNGLSGGSWSFWLNNDITGFNGILNQWGTGSDRLIYSWLWIAGGRIDIYFDGSAKYRVSGNTVINALNTGEWINLVIVFDGTLPNTSDENGRLKVYINGTLLSDGFSFVTGPTVMPSTTSDLILGSYTSGAGYFNGLMDEVAIWNNSLTQDAVTEIYNDGTPNDLNDLTNATDPSVWYRMGENSTFSSPQILMPENTNKDKVSNYSMEFDGVDDYIQVPNSTDLDFGTEDFTWSLWVNYKTFGNYDGLLFTGATNSQYRLKFQTSGQILNLQNADGDSQVADLGTNIAGTGWRHLCLIRSSGTITTFLDGSAVDTDVRAGNVNSGGNDLIIGDNGGAFFTGNIDEVSMFNSAKAIGDIWDGTGRPTDLTGQSGLVSWWRMGEDATFSTNWTIPDQIGSNNGTSANMTIEDRVGDASNSSNNSLSYNMDAADIVEDTPPN